jgi:hypothetical protein
MAKLSYSHSFVFLSCLMLCFILFLLLYFVIILYIYGSCVTGIIFLMFTSLLFSEVEWDNTYNSILSELYCPAPNIHTHIRVFTAFTDKKCKFIRRFIMRFLVHLCRRPRANRLLRKVVTEGLSIYAVQPVHMRGRTCCITGCGEDVVVFKLRTCRLRRLTGVIELGETGYQMVSKEWLTCIQSILICARIQKYIKHYATLDVTQSLDIDHRQRLRARINGAISYMITMFSTLTADEYVRSRLTSLVAD